MTCVNFLLLLLLLVVAVVVVVVVVCVCGFIRGVVGCGSSRGEGRFGTLEPTTGSLNSVGFQRAWVSKKINTCIAIPVACYRSHATYCNNKVAAAIAICCNTGSMLASQKSKVNFAMVWHLASQTGRLAS